MATRDVSIRISVIEGDKVRRELTLTGEEGQKALEKIKEATKPASEELVALNAASEELHDKFHELSSEAGTLGSFLSKLGPAGLIAAAAVGAFAYAAEHAIEESEKFEQAQRKLQAVLTATGSAAGLSKGELTELAETYEHTTLFTAEQVQQSEAILLTYQKIHSDVFGQALKATLDISSLFDNDLTSAARAVGRALEDPINGLTALTRQGAALDPVAKENIKNLAEMGNIAGADKLILEALAHSIGGQAEAQNQGLTGASNSLSKSMGELSRAFGENATDSKLLEGFINKLASAFQNLREQVRPTAEEELKKVNESIKMMQDAGTSTMLGINNPFYSNLLQQRGKLEDNLATQEKAKEEDRQKEKIAIAQQYGEELLALEKKINEKIKQETEGERGKILEEADKFKQQIQARLLPDGSNQAAIEKEIALADQLKNIKLDKIDQQEAEAAEKLAEANNKVVDSLEKRVKLEGISDPKKKFVESEADKLTPDASVNQVKKVKEMAAALYDEQQAAKDAKEAEEAHSRAIQKINEELLHTKPSYDSAKQALDEWRAKLIDDLGGATEENQKYVAMIDQIYKVKLKDIYNKSLQDSNDWQAGASRALQKYSEDATNAAKNMESVFSSAARKVEDTLTDMVTSGQFSMNKMSDLMKSIEQDVLRSMIRQNITGPIAGALSGMMGGGTGGAAASPGGGMFGSLFSGLSGMFSGGGEEEGGGMLSSLGSLFAGFLHEGGTVGGTLTPSRLMPAHIFAGSPRFHDGLMPDEFPAILQKGETVLPKNSKNSGMNVTMNISTPDAKSFSDSRGQIMSKFAGEMQRYRIRNS